MYVYGWLLCREPYHPLGILLLCAVRGSESPVLVQPLYSYCITAAAATWLLSLLLLRHCHSVITAMK